MQLRFSNWYSQTNAPPNFIITLHDNKQKKKHKFPYVLFAFFIEQPQ